MVPAVEIVLEEGLELLIIGILVHAAPQQHIAACVEGLDAARQAKGLNGDTREEPGQKDACNTRTRNKLVQLAWSSSHTPMRTPSTYLETSRMPMSSARSHSLSSP